ncbi:MAG TPA: PEPxxWA-CTERM sorting domain-containing protein [Caulobacteraceae bacterium]|jgi:hypothetical protein|nr:PEPxxWA-CTERM sorting domain-containing protein [Caulobacteraceae bacterium]
MNIKLVAWSATVALAFAGAQQANAGTVVVPGTSNPFLAGAPAGTTCCQNGTPTPDIAPDESPVFAGSVIGGSILTFSDVTGWVNNFPASSGDGPNGDPADAQTPGDVGGIAGYINAPINALVGVFLGSSVSATAPADLDFTAPTTTPLLQQIFFIGDGSLGGITAPTGATRLYLGTVDGYQWSNNAGAFSVNVAGAVPEPATWAMMLTGFGAVGAAMRSRRRQVALAA